MIEFEIKPHVGVGPVRLGCNRAQVHAALGTPEYVREDRELFLDGFFVDYDMTGRVDFIELARSSRFRATFYGVCLHEVPADQAIATVSAHAAYDDTDPEIGHSYVFPGLQLSLWRGTLPEPEQPPDAPDGRYFEAVGVAVAGYFRPAQAPEES